MVLYPNKLPESERVCSGICNNHVHDPLYEYDEYENLNEYLCHGCP